MSGYVAISRDLWNDPDFDREPMSQREAWIWLIAEASWKARKVRRNNSVIELQRGQLAHSIRFMAEAWGWKPSRVQRFLATLKNRDMIDTATDTGVSVITICNYDKYQSGNNAADTPTNENRYSSDTNDNQDKQLSSALLDARTPYCDPDKLPVDRLLEVAGPGLADPAKTASLMMSVSEISRWLRAGFDLELDAVPVVQAKTAQARGSPISTWTYFTQAVREHHARRIADLEPMELPDGEFARESKRPVGRYADRQQSNTQRRRNAWLDAVEEYERDGAGGDAIEPGSPTSVEVISGPSGGRFDPG